MKKMEEKFEFYEILCRYLSDFKVWIYPAFIFLNISADIVETLLVLMFFDTIFGIRKSYTLGRKIKFNILLEGIISKAMILLIPMVLALVGKGLGYDFKPLPDTVLRILVVSEGFSILTSMYVIRTKQEPESIDIVTVLIVSVRKYLMKLANFWISKVDNETKNKKE